MSVLVGAAPNKSGHPCSAFSSDDLASSTSSSDAGPSHDDASAQKLLRQFSTTSFLDSDEDEHYGTGEDAKLHGVSETHSQRPLLSPLLPLKAQLEKDKEDESLRRWKEKLLGSINLDSFDERVHPEVSILSLSIVCEGRSDIVVHLPLQANFRGHLFTLKEGSSYRLKFNLLVRRNIVSGLTYLHTVWKNGIRVDNSRVMLGTFAPQLEPHVVMMEEETTPSGILARGSYTARTKFIDDDGRCHFEIEHTFDIRKDWS